jgi:hypothetical protein
MAPVPKRTPHWREQAINHRILAVQWSDSGEIRAAMPSPVLDPPQGTARQRAAHQLPHPPHFGPLEELEYRSWLAQVLLQDSLSLYLHIPFCRSLCWYRGCHTAVPRSTAPLARYAEGLRREVALLHAALPCGAHTGVVALHLGGGTPSARGGSLLREVLASLDAASDFRPDGSWQRSPICACWTMPCFACWRSSGSIAQA